MSRYSDDAFVKALVRQAGAVLAQLGMPDTFTLAELHDRVEATRGRRVHVLPHPLPSQGPHGLWVMGDTDDYVFVDDTAPPLRRAQIISHEFGHILFDDHGAPLDHTQLADLLPTDRRAPVMARSLIGCTRSGYDEMIEQRCEWFGTVVLQRLRD
jgi:hypothetical protein